MRAGESSETATAKAASKTAKSPAKAATAAETASMAPATTTSPRVNGGWDHQANTGNQSRCH
jgi:hypothetical protein